MVRVHWEWLTARKISLQAGIGVGILRGWPMVTSFPKLMTDSLSPQALLDLLISYLSFGKSGYHIPQLLLHLGPCPIWVTMDV